MVFCRLSQPATMTDLSEVDLPTRFIFLALSPEDEGPNVIWELSEMGRSLGSMLGDKVCEEILWSKNPSQGQIWWFYLAFFKKSSFDGFLGFRKSRRAFLHSSLRWYTLCIITEEWPG